MRKTKIYITSLALLALCVMGGMKMVEQVATFNVVEVPATPIPVKSKLPQVAAAHTRVIDKATLDYKMASILKQYQKMDVSIALVDMANGQAYQYGKTTSFEAASTTKVLSAVMYLHEVERETFTLDQTIDGVSAREQLRKMVVTSDNAAWHSINKKLTNAELQTYAKQIGLHSYRVNTNMISASDTALLLQKLYARELLDEEHTKLLLSWMKVSIRHEYVSSALPENVTYYHKAGWLPELFHDAVIVDNGPHAYVLVIFSQTKGGYNASQVRTLFNTVTEASLPIFLTSL